MAFKDSKENYNQVWDELQGKWVPRDRAMVAFDEFSGTYKPVMGVLSNKSTGGKYTRLALTLVDAQGNPIGWSGGSKPVITRNLAHWSSDYQNGYLQGTGDNPVIPIDTVTNVSGYTMGNTNGVGYWLLLRQLIISNTSNTGAWLKLLQIPSPTGRDTEVARFYAPPNDTRIYSGEPLIKGAVLADYRWILRAESNVNTLYVTTLHYQDAHYG